MDTFGVNQAALQAGILIPPWSFIGFSFIIFFRIRQCIWPPKLRLRLEDLIIIEKTVTYLVGFYDNYSKNMSFLNAFPCI